MLYCQKLLNLLHIRLLIVRVFVVNTMGISHNIIDTVSWKSCCLFNMRILQMINYEILIYYYNRFRITILLYKYEICFDCCIKKMFQLEKEFQLSNTSQFNHLPQVLLHYTPPMHLRQVNITKC